MIAQTELSELQVRKLFAKPKRIKWVRHYAGTLDQSTPIQLSVGFDGKRCKGRLLYPGSGTLFTLEGNLSGQQISLAEKDQRDQTSGYLKGQLNSKGIQGTWRSTDRSISQRIILEEVPSAGKTTAESTNNRWVRLYQQGAYHLLVQRLGDQQYAGYVSIPGQAQTLRFQYHAENDSGLLMELLDPFGHSVGYLQSQEQENSTWQFRYIDLQGKSQELQFELQKELSVHLDTHADYLSSYELSYPQISSVAFNQWMTSIASAWKKSCDDYMSVVGADAVNHRPEMRAALRAYAWTDIVYFNEQLISGHFTEQKTWSDEVKGQSFIFDLRAERLLEETDIFNPAFPRRAFLWEKMKTALPQFPLYVDKGFRRWMENNTFPNLSLSSEGICFSTEFDMIYGQQQLIIPYDEVLPYLKKDSPVAVLARKQ